MIAIKQIEIFQKWWTKLKDERARGLILSRLGRLAYYGYIRGMESIEQGINELRIQYGPGYQIYFRQSGYVLIVLLCGATKTPIKEN